MKNINYNPKFNFKFNRNNEVHIGMTLEALLINTNEVNVVDVLKILKEIYFISYTGMGKVMGCSGSAIRTAILYGSFDGVLKPEKVQEGILNLQVHYLDDTYYESIEEVGAGA